MKNQFDYLIIGAGPAALQLGYYLEKNQRDYLILERNETAGSFFKKFPRHRLLISINKVHTGTDDREANYRWDWNSLITDNDDLLLKNYTNRYFPNPDILTQYLEDYAEYYKLKIQYGTTVINIAKQEDGMFVVTDEKGNHFYSNRLIVATGIFKPFIPDIPGVELCENYIDHELDPEMYSNKRVMIVGKGNSAFEAADHLIETTAAIHVCSPDSVKFAWQTHFVGHLRAINNNFLDTYQLKSQNTVIDAAIEKVEKRDGKYYVHLAYTHAKGQKTVVEYDHVIFCTGFRFDDSIYDESCKPELIHMNKFPNQTSEWESTNISDLYVAGTLMQACDYKKTMSGFIHGFRHNVTALANVLEEKYHDNPWPSKRLELTPEALCEEVIDRVNRAAAMFLQPAFLCDALVVDESSGTARYYNDLRLDYVANNETFLKEAHTYTISLEYGHFMGDPFNLERNPAPDKGHEAAYLHPIIRRYHFGELVNEYHINDDLESHWFKDEYVQPALAWFKHQLASQPKVEMHTVLKA